VQAAIASIDLLRQILNHIDLPNSHVLIEVIFLMNASSFGNCHFSFRIVEVILHELPDQVYVFFNLILGAAAWHGVNDLEFISIQ